MSHRLCSCQCWVKVGLLIAASVWTSSNARGQLVDLTPPSKPYAVNELDWQTPQLPSRQPMAWELPPVTSEPIPAESFQATSREQLQLFANQPFARGGQAGSAPRPTLPEELGSLHAAATDRLVSDELALSKPSSVWGRIWQDELNFYSPQSLGLIGGGLAGGAILANTRLDQDIENHLQTSLHNANSDDWLESLHANKELGDGRYTLPIFAGAWVIGGMLPESPAGPTMHVWGERTLRGFVVGAPPVLLLQMATGGSRPNETGHGSEWQPFQDNNGVSGHSFMGALPFITAAKMTDSKPLKATFYAASALAPLSRTADGAHYPSQVALGWWTAFVAASAVHATDRPGTNFRLYPTTIGNGAGMAMEYRY